MKLIILVFVFSFFEGINSEVGRVDKYSLHSDEDHSFNNDFLLNIVNVLENNTDFFENSIDSEDVIEPTRLIELKEEMDNITQKFNLISVERNISSSLQEEIDLKLVQFLEQQNNTSDGDMENTSEEKTRYEKFQMCAESPKRKIRLTQTLDYVNIRRFEILASVLITATDDIELYYNALESLITFRQQALSEFAEEMDKLDKCYEDFQKAETTKN